MLTLHVAAESFICSGCLYWIIQTHNGELIRGLRLMQMHLHNYMATHANYNIVAHVLKYYTCSAQFKALLQYTHTVCSNTDTLGNKEKGSFNICLSGLHPAPIQVQEGKQRTIRISLQTTEAGSKHLFSLFLFQPTQVSLSWLSLFFSTDYMSSSVLCSLSQVSTFIVSFLTQRNTLIHTNTLTKHSKNRWKMHTETNRDLMEL